MSDDIRALTAELAANPQSLAFLQLGEALRLRGQFDAAMKVARTGLARYPELAQGYDLLARILAGRGDIDGAFDAWRTVLQLTPGHTGAYKGLAFLHFRRGRADDAIALLEIAAAADPDDPSIAQALNRLRPSPAAAEPAPDTAPLVETPAEAETADAADASASTEPVFTADGAPEGFLLIDIEGLTLAGGVRRGAGDAGERVAAELAALARESARAARMLELGTWDGLIIEAQDGTLGIVAPTRDTVLLVQREAGVPPARVARAAERAARDARTWLEHHA